MIDFSVPMRGLGSAEAGFQRSARKIAADPTAGADPNNAIDVLNARNQYEGNLKVVHVEDEMTQSTLNLLA